MAEEKNINLEENPASDEELEAHLAEDEKKDQEPETKPKEPSLEDRIAGLETGISKEREKRRNAAEEAATLKGQLSAVQEVLAESMAKREKAEEPVEKPDLFGNLEVDVDEDGKAFVPKDSVVKAVTAAVKEVLKAEGIADNQANVKQLQEQFFLEQQELERERAFKEHRDSLLLDDENESYSANFPKVEKAYQWLSNEIVQYQKDNGISREFSAGEAIDAARNGDIAGKFAKRFPDMNLDKVARMYESDYDFGQALRISGESNAGKASMKDLKKLAGKASNLAGVTNQKAVGGDFTIETIADMSLAEMEKLSPEDTKKIEKILEGATT